MKYITFNKISFPANGVMLIFKWYITLLQVQKQLFCPLFHYFHSIFALNQEAWPKKAVKLYQLIVIRVKSVSIFIFNSLSACGVDKVALKCSVALGLRARAYRAIYDSVKAPHSDVGYRLRPLPRCSVRTTCVRIQITFGPNPVPMDAG